MEQIIKKWKFLLILTLIGGLFGVYPYIVSFVFAGSSWQGLAPTFSEDGLYYMTRADATAHYEFMTNPYYSTQYKEPFATFSIADSIAGVPYHLFSPFGAAAANAFFWSAILAFLLGILLSLLRYSPSMIIISWVILISGTFEQMLRATNMQIFQPYYILFFILLLHMWYRDRLGSLNKLQSTSLGLCAGIAPYLYTFLFQVIGASLFCGVGISLILRRFQLAKSFLHSILVMFVVSLPYFIFFYYVSHLPVFGEIMNHFNGVRSYVPSPMLYFYGRWILLIIFWSLLLFFYLKVQKKEMFLGDVSKPAPIDIILALGTASLGVFGTMLQSPILGVDVASVAHAYYFVKILFPLGLILYGGYVVVILAEKGKKIFKIAILFCVMIVFIKLVHSAFLPGQFPRGFVYNPEQEAFKTQQYTGSPQYIVPTLTALNNLPSSRVIVAPEPINNYIPLYTGHNVLFSIYGSFFSTGSVENISRSLASKLGKRMTAEELESAIVDASEAKDELEGRNRLARKVCALLTDSAVCMNLVVGRLYTDVGEYDQQYWQNYYETKIMADPLKSLHMFGVSDIVVDQRFPIPDFLSGQTPWYSDQYYSIYNITLLI